MKVITYLNTTLLLVLAIVSVTAVSFNDIDPSKYYNVYDVQSEKITLYKEVCSNEKTDTKNGTFFPAKCIMMYDKFQYIDVPTDKLLGITDGKDMIEKAFKKYDKVYIWNVPIGDRNLKEFGKCRDYEIKKGVCIVK